MSLRRLHPEQPDNFAFTSANAEWAQQQISKYPEGRQASAVIPLLWRGQEQEGWVTQPMIEEVARMLDMAEIRVLEVATFYFMFQLQPVGTVAHIQICGTTSCMICGAEDLIGVCKERIAPDPHQISSDGKFSWEEVECLGACSNAPMAQIGKDYFEDLTAENFAALLDKLARGEVPKAGPQSGRWASEPASGLTSLHGDAAHRANASVDIADQLGDSIKRIDGSDPVPTWGKPKPAKAKPTHQAQSPKNAAASAAESERDKPKPAVAAKPKTAAKKNTAKGQDTADTPPSDENKPELLASARNDAPDDLKKIKGVGPKLEGLCNKLGVWHFDQIASWSEREVAWVDYNLEGFKGRISRDDWVSQAKILAAGGETEFSARKK